MSGPKSNIPKHLDLKKKYQPAVSEYEKERTRQRNEKMYGGLEWIVRSPGNDLLDFYDRQNILLGKDNRAYSSIPPSVVYHYRFDHQYPCVLFDKSKNYGRLSYIRDCLKEYHHLINPKDKTYWSQVYNTRYNWLVDSPHTEYKFKYRSQVLDFLKKETGQNSVRIIPSIHKNTGIRKYNIEEHMFWRGNAKGWSIIIK